jgi:DNA-binding NarL/FixJ family response regulator
MGYATRVLLVDDHDVVISGIAGILASQDDMIVVDSLRDGSNLAQVAQKKRADMVLLDMKMGDNFDFFQALEELRKLKNRPQVIVISSELEPYTILNAGELGIDGYLFKEDALGNFLPTAIRQVRNGEFVASEGVKDYLLRAYFSKEENGLTDIQYEVLVLLVKGHEPEDIAAKMGKSSREAVYSIIHRLREKLEVQSTRELIVKAVGMGIVPD